MFAGKVVIVTGASSGIGAETAVEFAKKGAKLVLGGRNVENLKKTPALCEEQGCKPEDILCVIGDLTNEADCNAIVDKAMDKFKHIDVLVNNAGIPDFGNLESTTIQQLDHVFRTLVGSVFMITKRAMPHLKQTKGAVVNVSSTLSVILHPDHLTYGISKAALDQLTRVIAQDVGPSGVRVNSIQPAYINTPMLAKKGTPFEGQPEKIPEFLAQTADLHALCRYGEVEEVAKVIVFLSSSDASFMTGAVIPLDGGMIGKYPG